MKIVEKKKAAYIAPQITVNVIELENGIAAGSATINTGSDSQTPQEKSWDNGWTNNQDFDI
ncbi:MAG: hypothetical protein LBV59_00985 [Sphingobacterium sp.]|jgi:hypothetical protein|uniref:hypothetical protein n=1 Tax=Sphingobacterium sp. TaxID=341027 RepID=UPI00284F311E|nr:hypothetical protein [Sphingobacterium sp.]MDR3006473.1 hypothetical protein [Sphingobacterium sp.]